eukprot:9378804-Pyramimonas_sp.AAC.1
MHTKEKRQRERVSRVLNAVPRRYYWHRRTRNTRSCCYYQREAARSKRIKKQTRTKEQRRVRERQTNKRVPKKSSRLAARWTT